MRIIAEVILYSTGCPKCTVLKRKLDSAGVGYVERSDVDEMLTMGFTQAPILMVDGVAMGFSEAVQWVNNR